MPYVPHTEENLMKMLTRLGPSYLDGLRELMPSQLRRSEPLAIPAGLSEQELKALLKGMAGRNRSLEEYSSFIGAGAYHHYLPSVVGHLAGRSEFYTSYTPYQPEVSQGTLQAVFEYQTLICQLTGMDVSNASLYDGASAAAEAVLMAMRVKKKKKVLVSAALHPEYRETIKTYLLACDAEIVFVPFSKDTGLTETENIEALAGGEAACLVVQNPNFLGMVEDQMALSEAIENAGGLSISVVTEPLSMALLKPPGQLGADIAVGEAASFGSPLNFGGPFLGFMGVKKELLRQMPGRLVGQTTDEDGERSFCLTLATREQHIRRDRATSNICTNEGLCALSAAIYMASLGRKGLRNLALLNISKAEYLKSKLKKTRRRFRFFKGVNFNEFTLHFRDEIDIPDLLSELKKEGIFGGLDPRPYYPSLDKHLIICVTEMNTRDEIDKLADLIAGYVEDESRG